MTSAIDIPGLGTFRNGTYGVLVSEFHPIAALGGRICQFELEGYEGDPHPEDFVQAVRNVLAASDTLLRNASPYVHQYYADMLTLWGDKAPNLNIQQPDDVWRHVELGSVLSVSRDHDMGRDVFVSIECSREWEVEHGLQLVFKNGREISKVGPFDGHVSNHSAYADEDLKGVVYKRLID